MSAKMSTKTNTATKPPAFDVKKFDIEKFSTSLTEEQVTKQDAAKKTKLPYYTTPKYVYNVKSGDEVKEVIAQPVCITGDIKLVTYGIPQNQKNLAEGDELWYPTEKDRSFVKIPIDPEQPACMELNEMATALDNYAGDKANRKTVLAGIPSKLAQSYEYKPLIHEASEKMKEPKYNFFKANLDIDYETGNILTKVFVKQPNGKNEQQQITCLKDIEKYLKWGCVFRCSIMIQKLWVSKGKMFGTYAYGLGAKCMQIIIKEPGVNTSSAKDAYNKFMFDDEGEVDEVANEAPQATPKSVEPKHSSGDDDLEPPKKTSPKKETVKEPEPDDEDEEEDEKPKKPAPKKASPKKAVESDDEEEEEDEKPKKPTPKKASPKKAVESDEEDDEEEEEKPKAKTVKKPVKVSKPKKPVSSSDEEDEDED